MIIVQGTIPIKEEHRERALDLARWMEAESRCEDGCISYDFFVGLSNPNVLMLFQEWESAEALAEHFNTAHMERFLEALPEVLNGRVSTRRYAVEASDERLLREAPIMQDSADMAEAFEEDLAQDDDDAPVIH